MPQKIQPMGLVGSREAISAPTIGNASESNPVSRAKPGPGLCPGRPAGITSLVRKSSKRASPMSATHTAQSDQANHAAARWLIPPIPLPCFLVPFVTTITLPPSPSPRHSDNRYRCLMERQSDKRWRVPICTCWRIEIRVSTTIALLLSVQSCMLTRYAHSSATNLGGRGLFPDLSGHFSLEVLPSLGFRE